MRPARNWIYLLVTGLIFGVSCNRNTVYEEFAPVPETGWEADSTVVIKTKLYDTTRYHDIYLLMRTDGDYPFSNFYCSYTIRMPGERKISSVKNFKLARQDGKWLGTGMGDLRNFKFLIEKDFIVRDTGEYRFDLKQYMRVHALEGIRDVGILIRTNDEII